MKAARDRTLAAIREEGDGVLTLELVHGRASERLRAKAAEGDGRAQRILLTAAEFLDRVEKPRRTEKQPGCLLCNAPFRRANLPMALTFIHASRDDPRDVLASGICASCTDRFGNDYDQVKAAVMKIIDQTFGPTRALPISRGIPPGHA